jgi:hypothetical protein
MDHHPNFGVCYMSIGKPIYFDIEIYLSVVEMLIMSDEVEKALLMLNNVPAYYRDNPTPRQIEIRESLHKVLFTPTQYASADVEGKLCDPEELAKHWPGRAQLLANRVKALNGNGIKPNIMELGPGTFWLPYALRANGLDFTYEYQALIRQDLPFDKPPDEVGINILVAYELVEHLSNEMEIYQAYLKFGKQAKYIFLSTPLYTFSGGIPNWRNQALGHLRTYTPKEMLALAQGMFQGFEWGMYTDQTIIVEGMRI